MPPPTPPSKRLSGNSPRAGKGHQEDPSGGRGRALGRGRGSRLGLKPVMRRGYGRRSVRGPQPGSSGGRSGPTYMASSSAHNRRGVLADPAHGQQGAVLDGSWGVRPGGGSRRGQTHPFGPRSQAGWHTSGEVALPEGIHLEFLPTGSPELMPAERLWPLTNEALANRLFEEISEVEDALVERCVELLDQAGTIRDLTNYHWWPQSA
jgi:hypothetical protein